MIKVVPESLHKLLTYAENKGLGLILGRDSNCHSKLFGPTSNKRGENLELFIAKYNLQIENNCHMPTYESRGAKTCIDVTLTARLLISIMDWAVCQEENGSDHNTILYNLSISTTKLEPQWLWSKANLELFQTELDKHLRISKPEVIKQRTIDNMIDSFYKAIDRAMKEAIPKTKGKTIDNNNPWWTRELTKYENQTPL